MAEREIDAREEERQEHKGGKGSWLRDLLYPLNHAISCLFTDAIIQPFVGAWVQQRIESNKLPKWLKHIFESNEHHEHHEHHEVSHAHKPGFRDNVKHWFGGEIIGDLGAVPLTALIHHYIPSFAHGVRKVAEPVFGTYFEKGARRAAKSWALENHFDPAGPEARAKQKEMYDYEIGHLGDALAWNVLSSVINIETQKKTGSTATRSTLYAGKIFSTITSNALLLGARANAPGIFQKNEERVFRASHKMLGIHHDAPPAVGNTPKSWVDDSSRASSDYTVTAK